MPSPRNLLVPVVLTGALVVSGCGSSNKSSADTTSTTIEATTTTTTTVAATTTAPATTAAPLVTSSPTTAAPAPSGPQVSFSVTTPDCSLGDPNPPVTASWQVSGADSIHIGIDSQDVYEGGLGSSGSMLVPFTCGDQQIYYLVAQKGGLKTVKSKTRGP